MGRGISVSSGSGRGTLGEVQNRSGYPLGCPGRVGGPSQRSVRGREPLGKSGTGRGTLSAVRDWFSDPLEGMGRVGRPSWRSGTGRGTLS